MCTSIYVVYHEDLLNNSWFEYKYLYLSISIDEKSFWNLKSLEAALCAVLLAGIVWVLKMIAFRDEDKSYEIYENI